MTLAFLGTLPTSTTPPPPTGSTPPSSTGSTPPPSGDEVPPRPAGEAPRPPEVVLEAVPRPPSFRLRLTGGGRFGSVGWAGLGGDLQALRTLRESIRVALTDAGLPIDPRPFQPHLTVTYRAATDLLPTLADYVGPDWPVTDFTLVESTHGEYHPRHTWPLP
nr:2'-5' RNA ligase family protein [Actinoplanes awajinensis]